MHKSKAPLLDSTTYWFLFLFQIFLVANDDFLSQLCQSVGVGRIEQSLCPVVVWTVKGEVDNVEQFLMAELFLFLQYISPQSGEAPKTRSLERKQQDPVVLNKWRHSTYLLDIIDKVSVEMLEISCGGFIAVNTLPAHRGDGSFCWFTVMKVVPY